MRFSITKAGSADRMRHTATSGVFHSEFQSKPAYVNR
jgi:hypothetical protein